MVKKGKKRPLEGAEALKKFATNPQEQLPKKLKVKSESAAVNGGLPKKQKKKNKKSLNAPPGEDTKPKIVRDVKIETKNAVKVDDKKPILAKQTETQKGDQKEQKKQKALAVLQKQIEAKQKKKELRKQSRLENGQYKPENIKLTVEQLKERIEEIHGRDKISRTARRKLAALKKKLRIEEGTYSPPPKMGPPGSKMLESTKRKIRRHKTAVSLGEKLKTTEENPKSLEEKAKAVAQLVKGGKVKKEISTSNKTVEKPGQQAKPAKKQQNQKDKAGKGVKGKKEIFKPESDDDDDDEDDDDEENEEEDSDEDEDSDNADSSLNTSGDVQEDEDDEEDDDEDEENDDEEGENAEGSEEEAEVPKKVQKPTAKPEDDDDDDEDDDEDSEAKTPEPPKKVQKVAPKAEKNNQQQKQNSDKKTRYVLFVGNLPYTATPGELEKHFLTKVSDVVSVRIPPPDAKTKKPRGFGYVEFKSSTDYEKALSLHNSDFHGRRITVQYSTSGSKSVGKRPDIVAKNKKLHALRKQGKLAGSVKESNKRSIRRNKQKRQGA